MATTLAILVAVLVAICLVDAWLPRLPLGVLAGLVGVRTFVLYHDFLHGAILRGSALARCLLCTFGLLVLTPPSIWARSHNHHHRNVGKAYGASIGSYPIMTPSAYAAATRFRRASYALSRHPATIACGYVTIFFWGMCLRSLVANPRQHADSALAIAAHLGLLIGLACFDPMLALFAVVVPMLVASALGSYLFYAQHNCPGVKILEQSEWSYCSAALQTASFIRMGPLGRWFTGNIGYHHVHHVNAAIPFYRLPEAMRGIPQLRAPTTTTLRLRDVRRCLRLKLWDPEAGCLTGFARRRARATR